jgi:hypothetical protein
MAPLKQYFFLNFLWNKSWLKFTEHSEFYVHCLNGNTIQREPLIFNVCAGCRKYHGGCVLSVPRAGVVGEGRVFDAPVTSAWYWRSLHALIYVHPSIYTKRTSGQTPWHRARWHDKEKERIKWKLAIVSSLRIEYGISTRMRDYVLFPSQWFISGSSKQI